MQTLNGGYSPGFLPVSGSNDAFLDGWATQMAISEASRRLSRGGPGGQRAGSAMRISKPSSANNSPRGSMIPGKRRITVNGNQVYRRPQQDSQMHLAPGRPSRPVSWHPSTHLHTPQPHSQPSTCYPFSTPNMYADHQDPYPSCPQISPMMASYSNNASPCSAFSPLPAGFQGVAPQYLAPDGWNLTQRNTPYFPPPDGSHLYLEQPPSLTHAPGLGTPANNSLDWNSYMMHGMSNTTPPTPDSFVHPQQSQPAVSEDTVRYRPSGEKEDEGEILVGMGLYDTHEKCKEDPQLNNYRSTVTSLLGSTYRPTGKGLTLEQAWEPPKSDDDEEEDREDAPATAT